MNLHRQLSSRCRLLFIGVIRICWINSLTYQYSRLYWTHDTSHTLFSSWVFEECVSFCVLNSGMTWLLSFYVVWLSPLRDHIICSSFQYDVFMCLTQYLFLIFESTQGEFLSHFLKKFIKDLSGPLVELYCLHSRMQWMMNFQGSSANRWNISQVIQMLTGLTGWKVKWAR